MALAVGVVAGWFLLVLCGTWVIQIALGLLHLAVRLIGWLAALAVGLASTAVLAVVDRDALGRIWRNEGTRAGVATPLSRERRS